MPATTDRRVRRTRTLLVQALVSLILERGYARITVQDILDRADVGRSTFYAHFRDKEALLLSCFDGLREDLRRDLAGDGPGQGQPGPARAGSVVFAHAHQHRDVYRALCGRQGGTIVSGHLHDVLSDSISADLAQAGRTSVRDSGRDPGRARCLGAARPPDLVGEPGLPLRAGRDGAHVRAAGHGRADGLSRCGRLRSCGPHW